MNKLILIDRPTKWSTSFLSAVRIAFEILRVLDRDKKNITDWYKVNIPKDSGSYNLVIIGANIIKINCDKPEEAETKNVDFKKLSLFTLGIINFCIDF